MSAKVLNLQLQGILRASVGAFEGHMFEEVRDTIILFSLSPTPCVNPNTNSCSLCMWISLCCDSQTVREC